MFDNGFFTIIMGQGSRAVCIVWGNIGENSEQCTEPTHSEYVLKKQIVNMHVYDTFLSDTNEESVHGLDLA